MAVASRRTGKYEEYGIGYTEDAAGEITRRMNDEIAKALDNLIVKTIISKMHGSMKDNTMVDRNGSCI